MFMIKHEFQIFWKNTKRLRFEMPYDTARIPTTFMNFTFKVGCVFPMFVDPILPHAEFGPNGHQEDAPHFIFLINISYSRHVFRIFFCLFLLRAQKRQNWILNMMIPSKLKKTSRDFAWARYRLKQQQQGAEIVFFDCYQ